MSIDRQLCSHNQISSMQVLFFALQPCPYPPNMKLLSILLITLLLIQAFVEAKSVNGTTNALSQEGAGESLAKKHKPQKINCKKECSRRCSKTLLQRRCHGLCRSCCEHCKCVSSGGGGSDNGGHCSCYANLKTHGNMQCP